MEKFMKKVKLTVAYDGTHYCGWQIQPNGDTVEAQLNLALKDLLKEEIEVTGASRTDAGVHAQGNVAVFTTEARMPAEKVSYALNTRLPEDIRIVESIEVPMEFHPRYCEVVKTYEYKICNRRFPDPMQRLYSHFYYYPLDVAQMEEAAAYLVGEHDFTSFSAPKAQVKSRVRTIYAASVEKQGDLITIRITGNGFLYNMVRIIAGTLIRVGGGYLKPSDIPKILEAKDREAAAETAPARGLTLVSIQYPEEEKRKKECGGNI